MRFDDNSLVQSDLIWKWKSWKWEQLLTRGRYRLSANLGILWIPLILLSYSISTWSQWSPGEIYKSSNLTVRGVRCQRAQLPKISHLLLMILSTSDYYPKYEIWLIETKIVRLSLWNNIGFSRQPLLSPHLPASAKCTRAAASLPQLAWLPPTHPPTAGWGVALLSIARKHWRNHPWHISGCYPGTCYFFQSHPAHTIYTFPSDCLGRPTAASLRVIDCICLSSFSFTPNIAPVKLPWQERLDTFCKTFSQTKLFADVFLRITPFKAALGCGWTFVSHLKHPHFT